MTRGCDAAMKNMPFMAAVCILCVIGCCGCSKIMPKTEATNVPVVDTEAETSSITAFKFSHSGMPRDDCYNYSVSQEADGLHLNAELFAGSSVVDAVIDEAVLEELSAIAQRYHLDKWDGFNKTNSNALDGEGFSISITFADGSSVSASGRNAFPNGYAEAQSDICALFNGLIDKYGNLYPKTLASNELDSIMINFSGPGSEEFVFLIFTDDDGREKIDFRMKDGNSWPDYKYNSYGYTKGFPFAEVQEIIRKYDVPSWNGWDKTAENYNECEFFQIEFGYASGELISAIGTVYPNNYDKVRSELMDIVISYIEEYGDSFTPWN